MYKYISIQYSNINKFAHMARFLSFLGHWTSDNEKTTYKMQLRVGPPKERPKDNKQKTR